MKESIKTGFNFGSTSGTITTLGLMVGLHAGTDCRLAVFGGILTIAIADALSDAAGIHVSEEAEDVHSSTEIWESTFSTVIFKFLFACTFIVPLIIFPESELEKAVIAGVIWGFLLIAILSFFLARSLNKSAPWVVLEHLAVAVIVVIITHFVGLWIASLLE